MLPDYFCRRKLYSHDDRITAARVFEATPFDVAGLEVWLLFVRVDIHGAMPETIALTLTLIADDQADRLLAPVGSVGLVRVRGKKPGVVCDALGHPDCDAATVRSIATGRTYAAGDGEIQCVPLPRPAARQRCWRQALG